MLVLARKPNQSIMVGDKIEIRILDVKGDQVRIGIDAPRSVSVHRKEVWEDIQKANIEAMESPVDLTMLDNILPKDLKKNKKS